MQMSCHKLRILLHYYYSPEQWKETSGRTDMRELVDNGLLIAEVESYRGVQFDTLKLTERGRVYIQAILEMPLPVQVWSSPWTTTTS